MTYAYNNLFEFKLLGFVAVPFANFHVNLFSMQFERTAAIKPFGLQCFDNRRIFYKDYGVRNPVVRKHKGVPLT